MRYNLFLLLSIAHLAAFSQKAITVDYDLVYNLSADAGTKKIKFLCLVPQDIKKIQTVSNVTFSPNPVRIFNENSSRYAEFIIDTPAPENKIKISITLDIYQNGLRDKNNLRIDSGLERYLISENYIEADHPQIIKKSQQLQKKSEIETLKGIYSFVCQHMSYSGYNPKSIGAVRALEQKHGDCTEYTDLFVALCRANNIPARVITGYTITYTNTPKHNWAEAYTKEYGWLRFDPTVNSFNSLNNRYIYLSSIKNDPTLNNFDFYTWRFWGTPIKVTENFEVKKIH